MLQSTVNCQGKTLPPEYAAIPITKDETASVLRICVLVKQQAEPVWGSLVVLRDTMEATVLLGCLIDGGGTVHEWLEIWIQTGQRLISASSAARQSLSNAVLDRRWHQNCQAFDLIDGPAIIKTGWESERPFPTFLDVSEGRPVCPVEAESGIAWKLCMDEGLLQQKGLPGYGGSLHRYLYLPEKRSESPLVPVSLDAPTNESTQPLSEIIPDLGRLVALNAQAGFMLVKKYVPIDLETFVDVLSGKPWDGLRHGKSLLDLGEFLAVLGKEGQPFTAGGALFLETQGRSGRFIETFYLKLKLAANLVSSVHTLVKHLQRPLFTLNPGNWQIRLGEPGCGLPFLWTAQAVITDPGNAIPLTIEHSDAKCYRPNWVGEPSIYSPMVCAMAPHGRAMIRIRQVLPDSRDTTVVEGTFATQERIELAEQDLVCFRLSLASGEIKLYARLEVDTAMAAGEWRFRTVAQHIGDTEATHLREAEGIPTKIAFEVVPLLSVPCDLYSLAVMAVRILLVDKSNSLPKALDEMLSLLRQTETHTGDDTGLEQIICQEFEQDERWQQVLGPQHLILDELTPAQAFDCVGQKMWWTTLAIILRMFPGPGPHAVCKHFGDAPQGAPHTVFEETLERLDMLLRQIHALVVPGLEGNREIVTVIQKFLV